MQVPSGKSRGAAYTKWVAVIGREPKPMTANYEQAVIDHVIDLLQENGRPIALIELIPEALASTDRKCRGAAGLAGQRDWWRAPGARRDHCAVFTIETK